MQVWALAGVVVDPESSPDCIGRLGEVVIVEMVSVAKEQSATVAS
jgi:hypothetical protein